MNASFLSVHAKISEPSARSFMPTHRSGAGTSGEGFAALLERPSARPATSRPVKECPADKSDETAKLPSEEEARETAEPALAVIWNHRAPEEALTAEESPEGEEETESSSSKGKMVAADEATEDSVRSRRSEVSPTSEEKGSSAVRRGESAFDDPVSDRSAHAVRRSKEVSESPAATEEKSSDPLRQPSIASSVTAVQGAETLYNQWVNEELFKDGMDPAETVESMIATPSRESTETVFGLASSSLGEATVPASGVVPVVRAASMQALIDQISTLAARLADSGGGQFRLEWGGTGNDQVRVEVALRDGRWQVEFRSANPELTRFLEREWSQTEEARQLASAGEAEVAFSFDQADDQRHSGDRDDLTVAEASLLRRIRQTRYSRNHS